MTDDDIDIDELIADRDNWKARATEMEAQRDDYLSREWRAEQARRKAMKALWQLTYFVKNVATDAQLDAELRNGMTGREAWANAEELLQP